jgi:F-type H+-transporting ATPase subunit c
MLNRIFFVMSFLVSSVAFAEEGAASSGGNGALAAAICMGVAVFGGAIGQSRAAAAALEGIGRNPAAGKQLFTPMIIALALIESLVLLAFVVAFIKIQA